MKHLFTVFLLIMSTACATTHPDKVPEIDAPALPALELKTIKPRTIDLKVENLRPVNQKAGNKEQVEKVVYDAFVDAATRGEFKVGPKSPNHLLVKLEDCDNTPEGAECVQVTGIFKNPRMTLEVSGAQTHSYTSQGGGHAFGDVSQAYQGSLKMVIEGLEKQLHKVNSR